jgi:hypothetical protein
MLHYLLLKELTIFTLLYDLHRIILCCGPVESMLEWFFDDWAPWRVWLAHTLMYILKQLYTFFSGDAFLHHPVSALSIHYPIDQVIYSRLAPDALNFNIVIWWWLIVQICPDRLIQSFAGCCGGSSITIRSALTSSLVDSSGFTEGLDNLSTITSGGVGALEEAIQARWSASWLS